MPIKIVPGITRSNSLPLLRTPTSPAGTSSATQVKPAKISADTGKEEVRRQILDDMALFIDHQSYLHAARCVIKNANTLTLQDLFSIQETLAKKTEHKHTREKVIEWMKYYVANDSKAATIALELNYLHGELEGQIAVKLQKEKAIINNELSRVCSFGVNKSEYLTAFSVWLKGKTLAESKANILQWRKFIDGCLKVRAKNEHLLTAGRPLIAFQGLHPVTTDLFMELTNNLQRSSAMLAEPPLYTKMNELITSCIDRVAPDPSSDVDSYTSLHEPNDGVATRIVHNVTEFGRNIFNGSEPAQKWYLELIKHGSQWHVRGSNPALTPYTLLQSFEWSRNDDRSLTRKIAMTTYLDPHIKTHSLTLNLNKILAPHLSESTEGIALRLLQRMANNPHDERSLFFDDWLAGKNHATPHDEELLHLFSKNPQLAEGVKADFLSFLKDSSDVHARFVYELSARGK